MITWSFSKLMVFETCPWQYKLRWLDKVADTMPHAAADRGTLLHKAAEDFVRGERATLAPELRHFEKELQALRTHYSQQRVVCEEEWGFDKEWRVCPYNKAWLRLKCDVVCRLSPNHILIVDNKTGKRFGNEIKHAQQLQLYALCTLLRYPDTEKTTNELWYLDKNELASFELHRKQLGQYLKLFDRRARTMTECKTFKPRPNAVTCRYCPYAPHNQGECTAKPNAPQPLVFTKRRSKTDELFENEELERYMR